jgi:hypothetical protein
MRTSPATKRGQDQAVVNCTWTVCEGRKLNGVKCLDRLGQTNETVVANDVGTFRVAAYQSRGVIPFSPMEATDSVNMANFKNYLNSEKKK